MHKQYGELNVMFANELKIKKQNFSFTKLESLVIPELVFLGILTALEMVLRFSWYAMWIMDPFIINVQPVQFDTVVLQSSPRHISRKQSKQDEPKSDLQCYSKGSEHF